MLQHPADIPPVGWCWTNRATAINTVPKCTVTTGVPGVALMLRWASTSQCAGVRSVPPSCENTRCVWLARRLDWWWLPRLLTTSGRLRTAESALTGSICKGCASHVTTERRRVRPQVGADYPPGGAQSLQTAAKDACACQDFCACKLKPRGDPPERKINGRKKAAPH